MRRTWGAAVAAVALVATALVSTGGSAEASPRWTLDSKFTVASFDFTLLGRIPHAPGNAHSGGVGIETDGDNDQAGLLDWNCPAGVVPPAEYAVGSPANPPTTCTLLRAYYFDFGKQYVSPQADWRMRRVREFTRHPVYDTLHGDVQLPYSAISRFTLTGVGPVTTTVDNSVAGWRQVTKTRDMRVSGRFAWINFNDRRLRVTDKYFVAGWLFHQAS